MDTDRDYYAVLGVAPGAEDVVIRAAYRALSQRWHPDKVAAGEKEAANRRMAEINEAFDVLGDAGRRRAYDARRRTAGRSTDGDGAPNRSPRTAWRLDAAIAGRIAFASTMLLALMLAVALGVEEKSGLRIAWEYVTGGFSRPSHYVYHWPTIATTLGVGWLVARRIRAAVVRALQRN
jgi:curved DNA-binding protein CbpA